MPDLLESLMLKGCIVTLDAPNCQTKIAQAIVEQEVDYLLALKGNQGTLYEDVTLLFETLSEDLHKHARYTFSHDHTKTVDKDHGRIEVPKPGPSAMPTSSPACVPPPTGCT